MDHPFVIDRLLSRTLADMSKYSQQTIHHHNTCILAMRDTIIVSDRRNLLLLKEYLTNFTLREAGRNFDNTLIGLYLQLIELRLKSK